MRQFYQSLLFSLVLSGIFPFCQNLTFAAAPESKVIPFWQTSNENATATIEHKLWQNILDNYVSPCHEGASCFDYAKLLKNEADRKKLQDYLNDLQSLDPRTYAKVEQKAYWINLYNALTVSVVLEAYPVESITNIHKGLFGFGPWNDVHAKVAEQELTLNNIEHGILRPIWQDNRIHYAVNCASYGCPNLDSQAYTAKNTEELLETGAKNYVNHPRGVTFKENDNQLILSKIYEWYKVDFGNSDESVITHLIKYANADLAERLKKFKGSISYDYDWKLNQLK
jgi:hypothetical protein